MATSLGGLPRQGVKMPSLGQCLYLWCSYLSPETFSEVLHSLADIRTKRRRWRHGSLVVVMWVCISGCLGSILGCFPDLKVTLSFGSKAEDE